MAHRDRLVPERGRPAPGAEPAEPTLEDGYLLVLDDAGTTGTTGTTGATGSTGTGATGATGSTGEEAAA